MWLRHYNENTSKANGLREHVKFKVTSSQLFYMNRVRDEIATEMSNTYQHT